MASKIISFKRSRRGFTLMEYLVAMGISSLFIAGTISVFSSSNISIVAMSNYADLESRSRQALDRMSKEIRQVRSLKSSSTNSLTFVDYDGADLQYNYVPGAQTLSRVKDGRATILLTECQSLNFAIFQRNTISDTYDQFPTLASGTCKLVQLNWVCIRRLLGARINTESVQSAKIVIRAK